MAFQNTSLSDPTRKQVIAITSVDVATRRAKGMTQRRSEIEIDLSYHVGGLQITPAVGEHWMVSRSDSFFHRLISKIPFNAPELNVEPAPGQVQIGSSGPLELHGSVINARAPLAPPGYSTAERPDPATVPAGATIFDTTLAKVLWSDGVAWQDSLSGKENTIVSGTTSQYWRGDKTWQDLNQDAVPDGTTNKAYTATEKTKLADVASGATANTGTVTTASVVSANGFAGSVAAATTAPAITISTSITGVLKGNGTAISAATAGTDYLTPGATQTVTATRITPRIGTTTSTATPSIDCGLYDQYNITALAVAITSVTITGTPTDGQKLLIRIKGDATPRTIAWGASFVSSGSGTLLATTAASKTHNVGLIYDSAAAKWVCVASDASGY
jgi:hypothetical protein